MLSHTRWAIAERIIVKSYRPEVFAPGGGGGILPYKGLMGTCGQSEYMLFRIFVLNRVSFPGKFLKKGKVLGTGYQNSGDFCLKQGQGLRGRAAPPHSRIYRVPPLPGSYCLNKMGGQGEWKVYRSLYMYM